MPDRETSASAAPPQRYRVFLFCPTPLAQPALEVDAGSPEEAWQKFCAANGISGSEHQRSIEPV